MEGEEAAVGERAFCVRKTEPWALVWVVVRRVVRRVRNCGREGSGQYAALGWAWGCGVGVWAHFIVA